MIAGLWFRDRWRFLGHMLWFDTAVSVPIALILASALGEWLPSAVIATIYSHAIGSLCFVSGAIAKSRLHTTTSPTRFRLTALTTNFVAGVAGAEVSRRIVIHVFDYHVGTLSGLLSIAIGASVSLLLGALMTNQELLRFALQTSQAALQERELAEAHLLRAKTEAELTALQARINPHFLFNTLNSISALVGEDPAKAEQVIGKLASLFRYALQSGRRGVVPIEEELTIVRGYLDIEQVRLGDRLRVAIDVEPALLTHTIPVLLLQPIVENAITHGVAPKVDGGFVELRGWREGAVAIFTVTDDGDGTSGTPGTGEGLENVRQRLLATYGPTASVHLERLDRRTQTRLVIPLRAPDAAQGLA
jgi:hypothetical protein